MADTRRWIVARRALCGLEPESYEYAHDVPCVRVYASERAAAVAMVRAWTDYVSFAADKLENEDLVDANDAYEEIMSNWEEVDVVEVRLNETGTWLHLGEDLYLVAKEDES